MKYIIAALILLVANLSRAEMYNYPDGTQACLTDVNKSLDLKVSSRELIPYEVLLQDSDPNEFYFLKASRGLTCEQLDRLNYNTQVSAIIFQTSAIALSCTGIGAGFGILLQGMAVTAATGSLYISKLPCHKFKNEKEQKKRIKEITCDVLIQQGIECNPNELREEHGVSI